MPGDHFRTDDELLQASANIGTTIFHPTCTAKMGRRDDPFAVVDERLRVMESTGCVLPMLQSCRQ